MPRHQCFRTNPVPAGQEPTDPNAPLFAAPGGLTAEQVERWAALIADGRVTVPDELPSPDRERLLAAVRERLRVRLVRHIARVIALDLRGAAPSE
jgi:hypothetical protein